MQLDGRASVWRRLGCLAGVGIATLVFSPAAKAGHAPQFRSLAPAGHHAVDPPLLRSMRIDAVPLQVFGGGRPSVASAVPAQVVKITRRDVSPRSGKGPGGERLADPHARPTFAAVSRSAQAVLIANAAHLPRLCRWLL